MAGACMITSSAVFTMLAMWYFLTSQLNMIFHKLYVATFRVGPRPEVGTSRNVNNVAAIAVRHALADMVGGAVHNSGGKTYQEGVIHSQHRRRYIFL